MDDEHIAYTDVSIRIASIVCIPVLTVSTTDQPFGKKQKPFAPLDKVLYIHFEDLAL